MPTKFVTNPRRPLPSLSRSEKKAYIDLVVVGNRRNPRRRNPSDAFPSIRTGESSVDYGTRYAEAATGYTQASAYAAGVAKGNAWHGRRGASRRRTLLVALGVTAPSSRCT